MTATSMRTLSKDGSMHVTDEVINTVISTLGAIFSFGGTVLLIVAAAAQGKPWTIVGCAIYGASLFNMFLISALHHGIDSTPEVEARFRLLDYVSVFLLIGGTYTPFGLILLRNPLGWSTLCSLWVMVIVGITIKVKFPHIPKWFTNTLYVGMGWLGLFAAVPVGRAIGWDGAVLFLIGGIIYTVGSFVYYFERPNPLPGKFGFHEIWHLFVFAAAATHYLVVFFYLLPR